MNLSPRGIREHLKLNKPIYARTVRLWPFRPRRRRPTADFSWEKTDLADSLRRLLSLSRSVTNPRMAGGGHDDEPPRRRLYGRSRGKTLRAGQAKLLADTAAAT